MIDAHRLVPPRFGIEDVQRASDEWGANCGPAALALVAGMTLDEVRPCLGDFESKGYTNPTLMVDSLRRAGVHWSAGSIQRGLHDPFFAEKHVPSPGGAVRIWPAFGLARVQWEGPWTAPGVPMRVRYRHTHWVAAMAIRRGTTSAAGAMAGLEIMGAWMSPQNSSGPRCNWCQEVFPNRLALSGHLPVCPVKKAVAQAESNARRRLTIDEIKAVRERARKELAMEKEFRG